MPLGSEKLMSLADAPLRIEVLTCLPDFFAKALPHGIVKRAVDKGKLEVVVHNLRDYTDRTGGKVDDYAYGGGGGMVLQMPPIDRCIASLRRARAYDEVIYLCPRRCSFFPKGWLISTPPPQRISSSSAGATRALTSVCATHLVTREISIGAYVLTGGELPALGFLRCCSSVAAGRVGRRLHCLGRLFPRRVDCPSCTYTRPANYKGLAVPDVLLSGHEGLIKDWRAEQSSLRTETYKRVRGGGAMGGRQNRSVSGADGTSPSVSRLRWARGTRHQGL